MADLIHAADAEEMARSAARRVAQVAAASIEERGRFLLALCGGRTPSRTYELLANSHLEPPIDWNHVHLFWSDERCVQPNHADSNFRMAKERFLDRIPLPLANVHRAPGEAAPGVAAFEYESLLRDILRPDDSLDMVLLGLGADAHTASLFPGDSALEEEERWVVATRIDSKGPWRLTMTAPFINRAREVCFLVSGRVKAPAVARVIEGAHNPQQYPAQLIAPDPGNLTWIVDAAAARELELPS